MEEGNTAGTALLGMLICLDYLGILMLSFYDNSNTILGLKSLVLPLHFAYWLLMAGAP